MAYLAKEDLIDAAHQGLFDQPPWDAFLRRLRERIDADFCGFYLLNSENSPQGEVELFSKKENCVNPRNIYLENLYKIDPIPYNNLQHGHTYSLSQFVTPTDCNHQSYMNDLMMPNGIRYLQIMRLYEQSGYTAKLILWRADRDFERAETELLSALAPHLTIALGCYAKLEQERLRSGIADEAIRRLNLGWLTLDESGRITDIDAVAERLLQRSANLRGACRGAFLPLSPKGRKALKEALQVLVQQPDGRSRAVHISDDLDMLLVPMRDHAAATGTPPTIIAYLHAGPEAGVHPIEQLIDLFGLTRNEAALAIALARGRSLAEAAAEIRLTIETARNYSKRIYSKTGTRGQADLVRLVLSGILTLA
jgi:DNA-binding CsgD family transcriptional regulator